MVHEAGMGCYWQGHGQVSAQHMHLPDAFLPRSAGPPRSIARLPGFLPPSVAVLERKCVPPHASSA